MSVEHDVNAMIVAAKAGPATWHDLGERIIAMLRLTTTALDDVDMPGPAKKAACIAAVASLFDAVADQAVPAAARPVWWLARGLVRAVVIEIAGGAVEQILPMVRSASK